MTTRRPLRRRRRTRSRGQALVEFAIVAPILLLILAGIIQFGLIFWAQNTLTQVARDTGRWAASQQQCSNTAPVVATANAIAKNSSLIGYSPSSPWAAAASPSDPGVYVSWSGTPCPPPNNSKTSWVTVTIHHKVPIFFPWVPGDGNISTSTQFRMEPAP